MAYCTRNFTTKKELKRAVQDYLTYQEQLALILTISKVNPTRAKDMQDRLDHVSPVTIFEPADMTGKGRSVQDGVEWLEGPHAPIAHTWYAEVKMRKGAVVEVF